MSSDETVGQQQPHERPAPDSPGDGEIEAERERKQQPLASVNMEPGDRMTDDVEMLVIEAELACDGVQLDNPAKIKSDEAAEAFAERIDGTDLEPAWTKPWEDD